MMRGAVALWTLTAVTVTAASSARLDAPQAGAGSGWEIVVLGIAQDAGIPHLGCEQPLCWSIRSGGRKPERVASIGIVNRSLRKAYLIDATPDLPSQLHDLTGGSPPDGILLTHAHIGHYTGLMYLGRESIDAKGVPVYATDRMHRFLRDNAPWSLLVSRANIGLRPLPVGQAFDLDAGLRVTAYAVPHRDEFTDTVGFLIEGPAKKALYIPDIDQWQKWDRSIRDLADTVDIALLDGTFGSAREIPGRSIDDIPHPMMSVTRDLLRGTRAAVWFIHLNHTNAEIDAVDVVKDRQRFRLF
jgi:pyrroloquinoline quinone biosynthesis protein B